MKSILAAAVIAAMSMVAAPASHATIITYFATLLGPSESPPNASPGTGTATLIINTVTNAMNVDVTFSGLLGTTTASHIHCCTALPDTGTAGVATTTPTFAGFPLGVTSGTYNNILDLTSSSSYNPAFVTAQGGVANAEVALLAGLAADDSYLNIHTTVVPGGEIRGFLVVQAAPEPTSLAILATGLLGIAWGRKRISR
jgi:hypothetical protein